MKKCGYFTFILMSFFLCQPGCAPKESQLTIENQKLIEMNLPAAEQGDCKAMYTIGRAYDKGNGLCNSNKKAVEWYRKAANAGSFHAMDALAEMCDIDWVIPETLILMLKNRGSEHQIIAIEAMAKIKDPRFVEPLIETLETDNSEVINEAVRTLKKITHKDFGKNYAKWMQWFEKNQTYKAQL